VVQFGSSRFQLQYRDGMSLYLYLRAQPTLGFDAAGEGFWSWWDGHGWSGPAADIYDQAFDDEFARSNWDRTNGALDALTFRQRDLSDITGTDYTFDPNNRAHSACLTACLADASINALNPTGIPIHAFDERGQPIIDPSIYPQNWAPGVFGAAGSLAGGHAISKYGNGHQWVRNGGQIPSGGPNGLRMDQYTNKSKQWLKAGKALKAIGGAANIAGYANAVRNCIDKCKCAGK